MNEKLCEHCDKPLIERQQRFCSKSCRGHVVINSPKGPRVTRTCYFCSSEFVSKRSKYCSDGCKEEQAFKDGRKIDLRTALTLNSPVRGVKLKAVLIREGILELKCNICNLTEWCGKPAPLQLDHKNGINTDNRLKNLRLLCANCHAQTDTFCGKNIGRQTNGE